MYAAYDFFEALICQSKLFYNGKLSWRALTCPSPASFKNNMSSKTFFDCHMYAYLLSIDIYVFLVDFANGEQSVVCSPFR